MALEIKELIKNGREWLGENRATIEAFDVADIRENIGCLPLRQSAWKSETMPVIKSEIEIGRLTQFFAVLESRFSQEIDPYFHWNIIR